MDAIGGARAPLPRVPAYDLAAPPVADGAIAPIPAAAPAPPPAPRSIAGQMIDICQNPDFTPREKLILLRQQIPRLATEIRELRDDANPLRMEIQRFAQHHSALISTLVVMVGNLLTEDSMYKMQYATFLIHELCKNLQAPREAAGSVDDYLYHAVLLMGKQCFNAPFVVSNCVLTFLSSPVVMEKALQTPCYNRLKSYIGQLFSDLWSNRIVPWGKRAAPKAITCVALSYFGLLAFGSNPGSAVRKTFRVMMTATVLSMLSNQYEIPNSDILFCAITQITNNTPQGTLLTFLDPNVPTETKAALFENLLTSEIGKISYRMDRFNARISSSFSNATKTLEQMQRARTGEEVDPTVVWNSVRDLTDLVGRRSFKEQFLKNPGEASTPEGIPYNPSFPLLNTLVRVGASYQLGNSFTSLAIVFDTDLNTSLYQMGFKSLCAGGSIAIGGCIWLELLAEVGSFGLSLTPFNQNARLSRFPVIKPLIKFSTIFQKFSREAATRAQRLFSSYGEYQSAKGGLFQLTIAAYLLTGLAQKQPMTNALLAPFIIQRVESAFGNWGVLTPSTELNPLDTLPIQLVTAFLFSIPGLLLPDDSPEVLNTMVILLSIPEVLRILSKHPNVKRAANQIRSFIPGLKMHERMVFLMREAMRFAKNMGIPVPGTVTTMLETASAAIQLRAAQREARLPNMEAFAQRIKASIKSIIAIGMGYSAFSVTFGKWSSLGLSKIDLHNDPVRLYSRIGFLALGILTGIDKTTIIGPFLLSAMTVIGADFVSLYYDSIRGAVTQIRDQSSEIVRAGSTRAVEHTRTLVRHGSTRVREFAHRGAIRIERSHEATRRITTYASTMILSTTFIHAITDPETINGDEIEQAMLAATLLVTANPVVGQVAQLQIETIYESAWNTARRVPQVAGSVIGRAKDSFREAARRGAIRVVEGVERSHEPARRITTYATTMILYTTLIHAITNPDTIDSEEIEQAGLAATMLVATNPIINQIDQTQISIAFETAKEQAITAAFNVALVALDVEETLEPVRDTLVGAYTITSQIVESGWNIARRLTQAAGPAIERIGRLYRPTILG